MIITGKPVARWVMDGIDESCSGDSNGIGWSKNGIIVAGICYDSFTGASIAMHSRVDNPKLVNKQWLKAIFDYPFNQLNVKRVTGIVSTANLKAITVNERLGFIRETLLLDYFPDGDGIVYIMRAKDCPWLKKAGKDNE